MFPPFPVVTRTTATAEAIVRLVDDLGLGVRDAAYLLGLSFQRVQQVAETPRF